MGEVVRASSSLGVVESEVETGVVSFRLCVVWFVLDYRDNANSGRIWRGDINVGKWMEVGIGIWVWVLLIWSRYGAIKGVGGGVVVVVRFGVWGWVWFWSLTNALTTRWWLRTHIQSGGPIIETGGGQRRNLNWFFMKNDKKGPQRSGAALFRPSRCIF